MSFTPDQLEKAKGFITLLRLQPDILHHPQLDFFRDYLTSLGATIPPLSKKPEPKPEAEKPKPEEKKPEAKPEEKPKAPEPEPEVEEVEPEPEEVDPDLWEADASEPHEMGDPSKEVSDEANGSSMESFSAARQSLSRGNLEEAVASFTEAIKLNPTKAVFFASRADCFLKMKKPNAAIRDCDRALEINPDQAKAYKVRGTAKRYLGKYEEAIHDLFTGNKLDFDENTDEIIKGIKARVDTLVSKRREAERKAQAAAQAAKKAEYERRKKAAEEARKRAAEEAEADDDDMPEGAGAGMPPGLQEVLSDPEVQAALKDPVISAKLMQILSNPASAAQHASDPKMAALLQKLAPLFAAGRGGAGPSGPGFSGPSGPGGFSAGSEDDIDVD